MKKGCGVKAVYAASHKEAMGKACATWPLKSAVWASNTQGKSPNCENGSRLSLREKSTRDNERRLNSWELKKRERATKCGCS